MWVISLVCLWACFCVSECVSTFLGEWMWAHACICIYHVGVTCRFLGAVHCWLIRGVCPCVSECMIVLHVKAVWECGKKLMSTWLYVWVSMLIVCMWITFACDYSYASEKWIWWCLHYTHHTYECVCELAYACWCAWENIWTCPSEYRWMCVCDCVYVYVNVQLCWCKWTHEHIHSGSAITIHPYEWMCVYMFMWMCLWVGKISGTCLKREHVWNVSVFMYVNVKPCEYVSMCEWMSDFECIFMWMSTYVRVFVCITMCNCDWICVCVYLFLPPGFFRTRLALPIPMW